MDDGSDRSIEFRNLLQRAAAEEPGAFDALAMHASDRLRALAHRMLARYPHVRRWEETDDVFQAALIRLHRSLSDVKPDSTRAFFGLAITQIRRTLIDLSRHYFGAHGDGAHHHTDGGGRAADDVGGPLHQAPENEEPGTFGQWTAFHVAIETLPEEVRETFSLVWYGGLTQREAADILNVAERTVIRRMILARIALRGLLDDASSQSGNGGQS
jgi:RNA polymerase sigma-70 factor (ECF subfamily)